MKTKKYKKIVEENGYRYYETNYSIIANKYKEEHYDVEIKVGKLHSGRLEVNIKGFCRDESDMILAAMELAETPPEDREEEKKFLIRHKYLVSKNFYPVCMVWHKLKDVYRPINCRVDNHIYQAQFTLKEVEDIKIKLDTDLADFELVEVTDER